MKKLSDTLKYYLPLVIVVAVLWAAQPLASYAIQVWTTQNGDVNIPGLTPTTIDNMAIGQTTPAPGSFTTLTSTTAPSGAGVTALFASPPPIGGTAPAAGAFTTLAATSGEVINGDAGTYCATFFTIGAPAAATNTVYHVATRAWKVISIREVHAVAAGGASKVQVTKDTSTNAPGGGTVLLTNNTNAGFDLAATANTVQTGTLSATPADLVLAAGDRLAVKFANAIQSSSGIAVTACLQAQ